MSKSTIQSIIMVVISIMFSTFCKGGVPVLGRTDDGSERCFLYFTTYDDATQGQPYFGIRMAVQIKNISPNNQICSFPWIIKAFVDGTEVGSSEELSIEDFHQAKNLLRTITTVIIPERRLRQYQQDCYTNQCNDLYSTINVSFGLYSGDDQIDMTCPLLDSDEFIPNSHVDFKDLRFLGCQRDNEDNDGGWTQGPRSYSQYLDIVHQPSEEISSIPKSFDTHDEPRLNIHRQNLKSTIISDLKIFPNPADQYVNIELPFDNNADSVIELFDNAGRLVYLDKTISEGRYQLDLTTQKPGTYLLRFKLGDLCIIKKVIIMR